MSSCGYGMARQTLVIAISIYLEYTLPTIALNCFLKIDSFVYLFLINIFHKMALQNSLLEN